LEAQVIYHQLRYWLTLQRSLRAVGGSYFEERPFQLRLVGPAFWEVHLRLAFQNSACVSFLGRLQL
jgi:hypothetical protein